jgi:hypothetical protein
MLKNEPMLKTSTPATHNKTALLHFMNDSFFKLAMKKQNGMLLPLPYPEMKYKTYFCPQCIVIVLKREI